MLAPHLPQAWIGTMLADHLQDGAQLGKGWGRGIGTFAFAEGMES